ncbi:hypothetical protein GGR50DRAFT_390960 [Xylaria sp. CBS 124048]|nr:hypothetical protein GGR50DRAFT_390960 [Xylaria sp. CBS 124048]
MQTRTSLNAAALMALAAVVNGHITMKSPVPFGSVGPNKVLTTSPLTSANYPCQVGSNPATFYSKEGIDNKMAIGQPQTISFDGSAVHGGGSCQLALTKDPQPSASTSWMTILSIEGGCPSKSGTGTDEYQFTIPDGISPGDYVFAWTWISKLSGTQEFYMNCAPVTITGGSGKRDLYYNETMDLLPRDTATFPELMVANLAEINSCKSELSTDPTYPDPGSNVMKPGSSNKFAPISGSNCVPKGAKAVSPPSGSGSDSGSPASAAPAGSAGPASSSAAASSAPVASSPAVTSSAPAQTSASSMSTPSSFLTLTITPPSSGVVSILPTPETSSSSSVPQNSSAMPSASPSSSAPASPSSSAAPSSGSGSGSGAQGLTGPCQQEGIFNCIGGTSYQQCASGSWSTVIAMPPSTKCAEGQTMTLWARSKIVDWKNTPFRARRRV